MIKVTLGDFAQTGLESYFAGDVRSGVRAALVHYLQRLRGGRPPLGPPLFLDESQPGASLREYCAAVGADEEAVFEQQALRRGTTVEGLARHAVLLYLAELELLGVAPRDDVDPEPKRRR